MSKNELRRFYTQTPDGKFCCLFFEDKTNATFARIAKMAKVPMNEFKLSAEDVRVCTLSGPVTRGWLAVYVIRNEPPSGYDGWVSAKGSLFWSKETVAEMEERAALGWTLFP